MQHQLWCYCTVCGLQSKVCNKGVSNYSDYNNTVAVTVHIWVYRVCLQIKGMADGTVGIISQSFGWCIYTMRIIIETSCQSHMTNNESNHNMCAIQCSYLICKYITRLWWHQERGNYLDEIMYMCNAHSQLFDQSLCLSVSIVSVFLVWNQIFVDRTGSYS